MGAILPKQIGDRFKEIYEDSKIYKTINWINGSPILVKLALVAILTFSGTSWYLDSGKFGDKKDKTQVKKDIVLITAQILAGVSVAYGGHLALQRLEVSREDQITNRFTRGIDQLGNERLEVRLGGIYALERIAKDSPKDRKTVMEVLTAYFREHASRKTIQLEANGLENTAEFRDFDEVDILTSDPIPLRTDMQAILTILGRRKWAPLDRLDLSRVDLLKAYLYKARLGKTDLIQADFTMALLIEADLRDTNCTCARLTMANLSKANLSKANLNLANLDGACLRDADLTGATLCGTYLRPYSTGHYTPQPTDLRGADLSKADLSMAWLDEANLRGANLYQTNLRKAQGITTDQIKLARNYEKAFFDEYFASQLGLSTNTEESEKKIEEQPPSQN